MDQLANGAKVYFSINTPWFTVNITQTVITIFVVTVALIIAAFFIGRSLKKRPGRFQVIVEKLINMLYGLVEGTMGKHNLK